MLALEFISSATATITDSWTVLLHAHQHLIRSVTWRVQLERVRPDVREVEHELRDTTWLHPQFARACDTTHSAASAPSPLEGWSFGLSVLPDDEAEVIA